MPREWDATAYDALELPHAQWGRGVVERLAAAVRPGGLPAGARVLDAGCGTGRDAALVLDRWPDCRLVALDGSEQMLRVARERLGDDRVDYVHADLAAPLPVVPAVDAVVSTAAFHWVEDHEALFAGLAAVMRPGAPLTSDCGGRGNVAGVEAAIARVTGTPAEDWEFAGEDDTRTRLRSAGFEVGRVALRPDPFRIDDPDVLEAFLATVILGSHLAELPDDEHEAFVVAVRTALAEPVVDYVRLEIDAVRR